jgi:hypothetical protein
MGEKIQLDILKPIVLRYKNKTEFIPHQHRKTYKYDTAPLFKNLNNIPIQNFKQIYA